MYLLLLGCTQEVFLNKSYEATDSSEEIYKESEDTSYLEESETQNQIEHNGYSGEIIYSLRQVSCPECIGETMEISVLLSASFYEPVSDSNFDWIGDSGCSNNFYETSISSNSLNLGNSIDVSWQGGSSSLFLSSDQNYYSGQIPEAYYKRNESHSVRFDDLAENYEDAFTSISGFDYIEPYTMLWVDPSYAFEPNFNSNSSNTISWGPSGSEVTFQILITFYDYYSLQPIGLTNCFGPDIGYITIPSNYFSYPSSSYMVIQIIKHDVSSFQFDYNFSNIETHMRWEVVGTGMLR